MIAAKNEWCSLCNEQHIEGNHISKEIKPKIDLQFIYDKIIRYENLNFTSEYIHVAIKEFIKSELKA